MSAWISLTFLSSQPKSQPKSAAVTKGTTATRGKAARGRGGKAKNGRPAKKTAEELDSEMADYFGGSNTEGAAAATQPAANGNGDAAMDDEILVSWLRFLLDNRYANVAPVNMVGTMFGLWGRNDFKI